MLTESDPFSSAVMLRRDLLASGYTDKTIARLVRQGEWVRIRHGAYTDASTWASLSDEGRHVLRVRAVVAQARTSVVVSHTSGLPFHDAPTWGLDLTDVHVTRRDERTGRREAGVDQHRGSIIESDVVHVRGAAVMHPTRLALEVTTIAGVEPSLAVVNDLLHRRLTSMEQLTARYAAMGRWPWTLKTDVVLRLADPRIESVGESRLYYLCFRRGLPMPQCQYPISDARGRVVARVDFAWPELGVFMEFDGRIKYEKLLTTGQRASDVVIAEKQREDLVRRLTGWRCLRFTWADLSSPGRTATTIREALFPSSFAA